MTEIRAYTRGWWYFATPRELQTRAAAPCHPAFQLLFDTSRPFWIRVFGCRDVPRDWVEAALEGREAGVLDGGQDGLRVTRDGAEVRVEWRDRGGGTTLWLPAAAVSEFLARTLVLVPFGAEGGHIDWSSLARGSAA